MKKTKIKKPKREKSLKRADRLAASKGWVNNYTDKNIVEEYAKTYNVDKICAIRELRMNGIKVTRAQESQIRQEIASVLKIKRIEKKERERELYGENWSDEHFAFIVGYTSGGVPFRLTHREMELLSEEDNLNIA